MSLDMLGHIDQVFESVPAKRIRKIAGGYVNGVYIQGTEFSTPHTVTIQPATDREIESLSQGGERLVDVRRIYINDGVDATIIPANDWEFEGQRWKALKMDNRYWRNYCKVIVTRLQDQ